MVMGNQTVMEHRKSEPVDGASLIDGVSAGTTSLEYAAGRNLFMQGQPADSVYHLRRGEVKLVVTSEDGKEAIVAVLGDGEFLGEECLAGEPLRLATAIAVTDCTLTRIEKAVTARMIHEETGFREMLVRHLLSRVIQYEADLVNQLFNHSEKRLARTLLLLTHHGTDSRADTVIPRLDQENLAQLVGTTRSRVSHFMNEFRRRGFIDYNRDGLTKVRSGLLTEFLNDSLSDPGYVSPAPHGSPPS